MPVVIPETSKAAIGLPAQSLHRLCGRAKPLRGRKIKGAARRTVRPKSREETPKEGNEVSEELANLVGKI
jgi:hypothetical protein